MRVWSFNLKSINQSINHWLNHSKRCIKCSKKTESRASLAWVASFSVRCKLSAKAKSLSESKNAKRKGWKSRGSPFPSGKLLKQCWVGCDLGAEMIATRFHYYCLGTGFSQLASRQLVPSLLQWNQRCLVASPLNRDSSKSRESERKWGLRPKHGPVMATVVSPANLTNELFLGTSNKV